ncbi:HlyD family secretion protein [Rhizobium sp. CG5]|uniref:HlyD family secretion protein n=1 Tax=Rhizobium sp. CG5 TaxID=2726076 RepID=UPI0020341996|nr:HlyD family secretion protein [Rhizobium sp. CG5]MCM2475788.1 HlyD family secretion protein [Rhizobium sp. CG5]
MSGTQRKGAVRAVDLQTTPQTGVDDTAKVDDAGAPVSADVAASAAVTEKPKAKRRNPVLPLILLALVAAGGWYGYSWWTNGRFMVSTEDAYIEGDIAIISPKVSGYVAEVNVTDNQRVKAGDPLVTLDNGDYRIALEQADAAIQTEMLSLKRIDAQIVGGQASLEQAEAQKVALEAAVRGAVITQRRAGELQSKSVGTVASLDNAQVVLDQARANLVAGDASISSAKANIELLRAQRAEAESSVRSLELSRQKAQRDFDFTVLKAPYDGVVGNLAVQTGDLVSVGKRLAALVPVQDLYIDANFKETQIAHLVPGSKVKIHVDAFEDEPLIGTVTSIAPASGSVFSMLPAENATGNFTKVIQRVPVRIALPEEALKQGRLRAGLSVVVDVDTRTAPADAAVAAK